MKRTYQPNKAKRAKKHGFFAVLKEMFYAREEQKKEKDYVLNATYVAFFYSLI